MSARHGLTLLTAQRLSGFLAVTCAFLSCLASGELGPPLTLLFGATLIGSAVLGERFAHKHAWVWTALLLGALGLLAVLVLTGALDVVLAAADFTVLLAVHRLWNRQSERDELLLLLLSLLLVCAGAALSAELLFGFAFAAYAVCGTWALALTHLRWQLESGRGKEGAAALLHSRRLVTPSLLGALGGLALLGLVGAGLVFFTFPRVTIGGLRRASRSTPLAGLSNIVDLSGHGVIGDDPRVVLRVFFDPDPNVPELTTHWRARALEIWTGRGWRAQEGTARLAVRMPSLPPVLRALKKHRWQTVTIEAVAGFSDGVVLTPSGYPLNVSFQGPLTARGPQHRLFRDLAGDYSYQPVLVGDLRYQVMVDPSPLPAEALRTPLGRVPAEALIDLEVPANLDPRVRALAERLVGKKSPGEAALAVSGWLESNLGYTRQLPGEVKDPIADFLFVRKKGHCELFSSAMVLLLRAAGIPARNVTGYYGGVQTSAGYYAVRAGDAHSWVEVYIPGAGFQTYDPTPPGQRGGRAEGAVARLLLFWDALAANWRGSIVDYDLLSQGRALQRLGGMLSEAGRRLSGRGGGGVQTLGLAWAELLGMLVVSALLLALWWRRRGALAGRSPPPPLQPDQRRAVRLWRKARVQLGRAGIALSPGSTPRDAAARVADQLPSAAPALEELARGWSLARWGGGSLDAAEASRLLRQLRSRLDR